MTDVEEALGKIVTFYSYKGGVGRTMSLANVAFLAACNGYNVLMMDWDLEAPGLYHYFRGLVEPEVMSEWRHAKGVLDLAWQWRTEIERGESAADLERLIASFETGEAFQEVVRQVESEGAEHLEGKLDMIPAGSAIIRAHENLTYEQALAAFSWAEFLDQFAGGRMIASLRQWATRNYDLVLIDSRTGLADVAGICTMQLPDIVMLMFVLNRQNIEGAARVAAAIKSTRGDAIDIRVVPMRVSREGTEEEADALARAQRELTKVGKLEEQDVVRDLQNLFVKAEPSIPFMESLAPFNETKAALDPFTADMARLTINIVGDRIELPEIDDAWRSTVQGRLSPTLSTPSYLRQLEKADPRRAMVLVHQYVESALSSLAEGEEPSPTYLEALVEATFSTWSRAEEADESYGLDTIERLTTLLRKINSGDKELWTPLLIRALEMSLYSDVALHGRDGEFVIIEEMEELLSALPQTSDRLLQRADLKLRMARQLTDQDDALPRLSVIEDVLNLLSAAEDRQSGNERHIGETRVEALIQKSDVFAQSEDLGEAIHLLETADGVLADLKKRDAHAENGQLRFEIDYRLMRHHHSQAPGSEVAVDYAIRALDAPVSPFSAILIRIGEFAEILNAAGTGSEKLAQSLLAFLLDDDLTELSTHYFARSPVRLATIVDSIRIAILRHEQSNNSDSFRAAKEAASATIEELVISVERRFVPMARRTTARGTGQTLHTFIKAVERAKTTMLEAPTSETVRERMASIDLLLANFSTSLFPTRRQDGSSDEGA